MKKSLIALAVAGVVAAPAAFAASANVDVYGTLRFSLDHTSISGGNSNWTINDQTSRIGFKGSEDLGGGLKAVWQVEQQLEVAAAPLATTSSVAGTARNSFIGLAGGFGTVVIGRHDTPYKLGGSADVFADTSADSQKNTSGIIGRNGFDNRVSGTIAYISPDFSGFHFAVATVPGEGTAGTANGLMDAYSLVGVYANGPLKVTLGHENLGKEVGAGSNDKTATKFNIGYTFGDIGVGYTYERSKDGFSAASQTDQAHLASITYAMGPITLAGQYGKFSDKQTTAADLSRYTVGAIYGLSKRTSSYLAYDKENYGSGGTDASIWTMGINHSF